MQEANSAWNYTSTSWNKNGDAVAYLDGSHVLFHASPNEALSTILGEVVAPEMVTVNSSGSYTLEALSGQLTGDMSLVKQGMGVFHLNGNHDYTGSTEIWDGAMIFDGELQGSPVTLHFHTELEATGKILEGVRARHGSVLYPGGKNSSGALEVAGDLFFEANSALVVDLSATTPANSDLLSLNGNLNVEDEFILRINAELSEGTDRLEAGDYELMSVSGTLTGDLSKVRVEGVDNNLVSLAFVEGKIVLVVQATREVTSIKWNGGLSENAWDFGVTKNFTNTSESDVFIVGDLVRFEDGASSTFVNIVESVRPSGIIVNSMEDFIFDGDGRIEGNATLTKYGEGKLTIKNVNAFGGKVLVEGGTLEVSMMPSLNQLGGIGGVSQDADLFELNGGTLLLVNDLSVDRAIRMGSEGGTMEVAGNVYWNNSIAGGWLTKTGSGNLRLWAANNHSGTIIQEGTVTKLTDTSGPGAKIIFEGGTFQDNNNIYSYNTSSFSMEVPEGKTGTIHLDARCYYTGGLTGSGDLTVNIPNVRSDLNGDWSAYTGTIYFYSTYNNSNNYSAELRLNNVNGLPNAFVHIGSSIVAYNTNGKALKFGALTGTGSLTGGHNYEIGARNEDSEFNGLIAGGSITKVGTGKLTLTGNNTYTGTTLVRAGELELTNTSGSATGSGAISVLSGGQLSGTGTIAGAVYIESGGALRPGTGGSSSKLTGQKTVMMKSGSELYIKVNGLFQSSSQIVSEVSFVANGTLDVELLGGTYGAGKSFKIIDAPQISGEFVSFLPESPGEGLIWDTSELYTTGVLKVADASTGLLTPSAPRNLVVFPNPVKDLVFVEVPGDKDGSIRIADLDGRIVMEQACEAGDYNIELNMSSLPAGLYFVHYQSGLDLLIGKVLVE
ncbi:MAG: autotransporter-associated beta strand repeat-containing protein [Bacteroidales bacterium]|nr:autotransporter-associated beta strand repeat-containing protein [Bacteroidales bacterium]